MKKYYLVAFLLVISLLLAPSLAQEAATIIGWTFSGENDGFATIVTEGKSFSSGSDTAMLKFPSSAHALNIRSNPRGDVSSKGIATSDSFVLTGDIVEYNVIQEAIPIVSTLQVLDAKTNEVLLSKSILTAAQVWEKQTLDVSRFMGNKIKLRFFGQTSQPGWGWYTIIDDVKVLKNGIATGDIKNGDFESGTIVATTTQQPFIPDAIPKAEETTFKAFYRDLRGDARESSERVLGGVKEGELVAFEPSGNLTGKKVEWFDEWNGKQYKIAAPEFIKDNLFEGKLPEYNIEKTRALGIRADIERILNNHGIYRTFAPGEHTISLLVDGASRGSVKIIVGAAPAIESKKAAVILTSYDNAKPTRCCDGRDRDDDGFTGYGKNDDRDGWDFYEYENILFSRVNKYYSESSKGRLRFDWKIFDNNGKWVYVEPFFEGGGGFSVMNLINRAKDAIGGFDGKVMVILPIDAHLKFTQSAGVTDAFGNMLVNENGPLAVPLHELGHSLGVGGVFVELYPDAPLGFLSDIKKWGVMYNDFSLGDDFPPLMDAWSRVRIGWASEDLKLKDGKYSLNLAQKSDKVLTVRTTPILSYITGTRFLIESRSRAPHLTYFDRGAPDTGVVVYKINSLANRRDQVEIGMVLKNVGDELKVGFTNANFKLTKHNLYNDGTAEVEIKTGVMSNTVGAIVDGVTGFVNWVSGKSGPGSNETADLDLHAYYTFEGENYHVGLNYETKKYETREGVVASGDLLMGEYIFVPASAQNLRFEVSNKKLKDYLAKNPEAAEFYPEQSKFSIVYMKYDGNGKQTLTNPQITSLSLSEDKKAFSIPETGFLEKQTIAHLSDETINRRLVVLQDKEIIFSQDYTGDKTQEAPESVFQKIGNYLIIEQNAGPSNEIYKNDELLKEDYSKFMKLAYAEKDNTFSVESRLTIAKASAGLGNLPADLNIYIIGGAVALLVIAVAFLFLRKKPEKG